MANPQLLTDPNLIPVLPSPPQQAFIDLGIDEMWKIPGADGRFCSLADVEEGWNPHSSLSHLAANLSSFTRVTNNEGSHGTQVLSTIASNSAQLVGVAFGMQRATKCGIGYEIDPNKIFRFPPRAVWAARQSLSPGDVILFELADHQTSLPLEFDKTSGSTSMTDQISQAIDEGLVVVMSAGNGSRPIPRPTLSICVGACTRTFERHGTSNFGNVDCCAWGDGIDVGTTFHGNEGITSFTDSSAAAAVIAGIIVCVQSIRKAAGKAPLHHNVMRGLLRDASLGKKQVNGVGTLPDARLLALAARDLA